MVEYEIHTKKFKFGDNAFENAIRSDFGFEIKKIRTDGDNLIYEVERQRNLTVTDMYKIEYIDGVSFITIAD